MRKYFRLLIKMMMFVAGLFFYRLQVNAEDAVISSVSFFEWHGDHTAAEIVTEGIVDARNAGITEGITEIGAEGDPTTIQNMLQALQFIKEGNSIRVQEGLPELMVTDRMMALAQIEVNYAYETNIHWFDNLSIYSCGENYAYWWDDPYDFWYIQESENLREGSGDVSHLKNLLREAYEVTGFAINNKDPEVVHFVQDFGSEWAMGYLRGGYGIPYTAEEYEQEIHRYLNEMSEPREDGSDTAAPPVQEDPEPAPQDPELNTEIIKESPVIFSDVFQKDYYSNAVIWGSDRRITKGYQDGSFRPDEICSRADLLTFLWRFAGMPEPVNTQSGFYDVADSSLYYYKPVLWAYEQEIAKGYPDGSFKPEDPCLREHAVTFLWRMCRMTDLPYERYFSDVSDAAYYARAVFWGADKGIIRGYADGTFRPSEYCSRAHAMTFLYRLNNTGYEYLYEPTVYVSEKKTGWILEGDDLYYYDPYSGVMQTGLVNIAGDTYYFDQTTGQMRTGFVNTGGYLYYFDPADGAAVKHNIKIDQTYYRIDGETGRVLRSQKLFSDRILMEGIDISSHNGSISLDNYKDGFVIIRGAWGTHKDPLAERNMDLCEKLGIPYGIYVYSYAITDDQAESEADFILKLLEGRNPEMGVWYDIEYDDYMVKHLPAWPNKDVISRYCNIFCQKVQNAGYKAGVYASEAWFIEYIDIPDTYLKWIASWGVNDGKWHKDLNGECVLHQYTSVPLDRDVMYVEF